MSTSLLRRVCFKIIIFGIRKRLHLFTKSEYQQSIFFGALVNVEVVF